MNMSQAPDGDLISQNTLQPAGNATTLGDVVGPTGQTYGIASGGRGHSKAGKQQSQASNHVHCRQPIKEQSWKAKLYMEAWLPIEGRENEDHVWTRHH